MEAGSKEREAGSREGLRTEQGAGARSGERGAGKD